MGDRRHSTWSSVPSSVSRPPDIRADSSRSARSWCSVWVIQAVRKIAAALTGTIALVAISPSCAKLGWPTRCPMRSCPPSSRRWPMCSMTIAAVDAWALATCSPSPLTTAAESAMSRAPVSRSNPSVVVIARNPTGRLYTFTRSPLPESPIRSMTRSHMYRVWSRTARSSSAAKASSSGARSRSRSGPSW